MTKYTSNKNINSNNDHTMPNGQLTRTNRLIRMTNATEAKYRHFIIIYRSSLTLSDSNINGKLSVLSQKYFNSLSLNLFNIKLYFSKFRCNLLDIFF